MSGASTAVRADRVSKKFARRLKHSVRYGLQDMARTTFGMRRRTDRLRSEEFWAVRDVSFELRRGEVLGLIGANGSGKSTLLSMLNGIYRPDVGEIAVRGRVAALIQIGAGFHPMLTGRENIYVNGAILGMGRAEIDRKLDAIVDFSGVGEFVDLPVKHYSSGMYVRLGFSIAAHLEPDVLLVDEVLAVGDAEFRARSMERMWQMVQSGTVSIIFVSHNMLAVNGFCDRLILLEHGIAQMGRKGELIARYLGDDVSERWDAVDPEFRHVIAARGRIAKEVQTGDLEIMSLDIVNENGQRTSQFRPDERMSVMVGLRAKHRLDNVVSSVVLRDPSGLVVSIERSIFHGSEPFTIEGDRTLEIQFRPLQLKSGRYLVGVTFHDPSLQAVYGVREEDLIQVADAMPNPGGKEGFFRPNLSWTLHD